MALDHPDRVTKVASLVAMRLIVGYIDAHRARPSARWCFF
jgi:hypothetical protein